jgi:hypothetical protein
MDCPSPAFGPPVTGQQPGRVRFPDGVVGRLAQAGVEVGLCVRPVRAEYQHVDAEHPEYGVDAAAAVAGCFDEHAGIDQPPRQRVGTAAGRQSLAVHRPETRQRGEADP